MNPMNRLCVKILHCGNINMARPMDNIEKSIFYMPMGLFPLASALKEAGIDVEILHLDLESDSNIEDILDIENLDAIGLDCHWVNQSLVVLDTAKLIKQLKPDMFIFLGGYTASFFAEEILSDYPAIDAIIKGDGEVPIVQLCQVLARYRSNRDNLANPRQLEGVQNLVWRTSGGKIVCNELSYVPTSKDLDQLDFARIDLMRNWQYYRDFCKFWTSFSPFNQFPVFFLEVGRGCTYNCSFCGGNANAQTCISNRKKDAVRSIDSVISNIEKAMSFGYSMFFTCFEFENSEAWYIRLFRRIKQEKLKMTFGYGCWGLASKNFIDEISQAFEHVIIEVSPETSNLELRKKNKDPRLFYDNKELEECLEFAGTKANVKMQLYFGYFLPFDTIDTIFDTMTYITELYFKYSRFTEIWYLNLSTDPAASIYLQPDKYNIDIEVRRFDDFVHRLTDICSTWEEIPGGSMTLCRPKGISDMEALQITNKADLFNKLLANFENSVLLIINRSDSFNIISDHLRKKDLVMDPAYRVTPGEMEDFLLDLCSEYHIRDIEILETIDREFKRTPGLHNHGRGRRESDKWETAVVTEDEKNMIRSTIEKTRQAIDAEFDI